MDAPRPSSTSSRAPATLSLSHLSRTTRFSLCSRWPPRKRSRGTRSPDDGNPTQSVAKRVRKQGAWNGDLTVSNHRRREARIHPQFSPTSLNDHPGHALVPRTSTVSRNRGGGGFVSLPPCPYISVVQLRDDRSRGSR
jgi:hypothetical protein